MSNIRVTYSGLIAISISLGSVLTGTIFTLIVTRRLTPEEFGIWSIIGSMISYFLIAEPAISFWTTRQIARGEKVAKTSILSSAIFSLGSIPIYIVLSFYVSQVSNTHFNSMLIATFLLPVSFISQTLSGINLGHKPHATSYGLIVFESLKIPTGLILVYFLSLGVNGAIITTVVAYLGKIVIQAYFAKGELRGKFNLHTLKRWIKLSWLPLYSNIGHILWSLDVVVYSIITKSVLGVAYYTIAVTITSVISSAAMMSQALYPKLLAKGSQEHVKENFSLLMYFAVPLLGVSLIFSKPILFALNPVYQNATIIVIIFSFRTILYVITNTFYQILMGMETIDVENNYNYSSLAKSRIFSIPTMLNIQSGLYICSLVIVVFLFNSNKASQIELVTYWTIISLSLQIPFLINSYILVKKQIKFSFPYVNTIKYVIATISFALVFFLTSHLVIDYQNNIYNFLPKVILELLICMSVYIAVTFVIDKRTRTLIKSIFGELISK
ncbi:MAG: oligosaccharide flippase family protein [Nitrosotalea sp.]